MTSFYKQNLQYKLATHCLFHALRSSVNMVPRRHIASTTGVNPQLICLLCGMKLPYTGNSRIANTGERDQILKQQ